MNAHSLSNRADARSFVIVQDVRGTAARDEATPWRRVPRAGPQTCHKSALALSRKISHLATQILKPATGPARALDA